MQVVHYQLNMWLWYLTMYKFPPVQSWQQAPGLSLSVNQKFGGKNINH